MEDIMISVIVPIYNAEPYLAECIRHLKSQTLKEIEFICVDNCSTDRSRDILKLLTAGDDRFRIIYQDVNRGQANSINRALDIARGEYIAECDADDYALPEMYRILAERAEGCDIVKCNFISKTKDTMTIHEFGFPEGIFRPTELKGQDRINFTKQWPHLMSAIYRREFILKNGLRYREGPIYEDTSLLFKLNAMAETYRFVDLWLYVYRRDNPGSGTATIKDTYAIFEQLEEIERFNREHSLGLEKEIEVIRYRSYMWNLSRIEMGHRPEVVQRMREEFRNKDQADPAYFDPIDLDIYDFLRG